MTGLTALGDTPLHTRKNAKGAKMLDIVKRNLVRLKHGGGSDGNLGYGEVAKDERVSRWGDSLHRDGSDREERFERGTKVVFGRIQERFEVC